MEFDDITIKKWQNLLDSAKSDHEWVAKQQKLYDKRRFTQEHLSRFVLDYVDGKYTTNSLKEIFDKKTRNEWTGYGLKGMSGAMFLNMLVKYIPEQDILTRQLKLVIPCPKDESDGKRKMRAFHGYLLDIIKEGEVTKRDIQPARVPFFVSALWHVQKVNEWPIYYISARKKFIQDSLYEPAEDPVEDYFHFRQCFIRLQKELNVDSWDLDQIIKKSERDVSPQPEGENPDINVIPDDLQESESKHTYVQWLLADVGKQLGCNIWIAKNDQNKKYKGKRLGELSEDSFPNLGMDSESQKAVSLIDVLWLKGKNQVVAAFEIEQTTSIYSGILRMSDLVALCPNLNIPLYIVAPSSRLNKVAKELSRPTFKMLELPERCGFFSDERLEKEAPNIIKWATSPSAIDNLAQKIVEEGENE